MTKLSRKVFIIVFLILTLTIYTFCYYTNNGIKSIGLKKQFSLLKEPYLELTGKKFMRGHKVTRADIADIIFKIEDMKLNTDYVFADTFKNDYRYEISSVVKKGYMNCDENNKFYPNRFVTKSEFAKIIYNILLANSKSIEYKQNVEFYDIYDSWAAYEIQMLGNAGYILGDGGYFNPNSYITKEEIVILLNRVYGYEVKDITDIEKVYLKKPYNDINVNDWFYKDIVVASVGVPKS